MKLLTVNVHAWLEENQDEKLDILAQTIAERLMMSLLFRRLISL